MEKRKKEGIKKAIGTLWHLFLALSGFYQLMAIIVPSGTTIMVVVITVVVIMPSVSPSIIGIIAIIVWITLFFSTIYALGWYNRTKQAKEATKKEEEEKERRKRNSLRSKLDKVLKYSFNYEGSSPLIDNSIKLINLPKHPSEIEQKIAEYNKKAEDLIDLFTGCGYFVKDIVIKNALMYFSGIDVLFDNEKKVILWELGESDREQRLSKLLAHVLKDRVIRGDEINKSVFENIDSTFYDKVVQHSSQEQFKYFLRDLNQDINYQRRYGCLKLLARVHEEAKKLAKDLQDDKYLKTK